MGDYQVIDRLIPHVADEGISNFWFIDYRIKPKPTNQSEAGSDGRPDTGRKVFWGSDRRYVQVLHGDDGYELEGKWPDGKDGYYDTGPWGFVQALEDELSKYWEGEIYWSEEWSTLDHSIEFGVLACEYL